MKRTSIVFMIVILSIAMMSCTCKRPDNISGLHTRIIPPVNEEAPSPTQLDLTQTGEVVYGDGWVGFYKAGNEDALCGFLGLYGGDETLLLGTVYCGDREISRGIWVGKEGEESTYEYVEYEGELDFPPDKGAGNLVKPFRWLKNVFQK